MATGHTDVDELYNITDGFAIAALKVGIISLKIVKKGN